MRNPCASLRFVAVLSVLVVLALGACGKSAEDEKLASDLQGFCKIATEVVADPSIDKAKRGGEIARRLRAMQPGKGLIDFLQSIAGEGTPANRAAALTRAAAEHGLPDFKCPALTDAQ